MPAVEIARDGSCGHTTVITGSLVAILPLIALFFVLQRYWQVDLAAGATKG